MKALVKRTVQKANAAFSPIVWRWRRQPRLLVMMYHRVLPATHMDRAFEQPGMFVSPETLAMHLAVLREHFTFMQLDEWIAAADAGKALPARTCAITFDDGWKDNYTHAFPLLSKAQVPATIFLVADAVGTSYAFWPNRLMRLLSGPSFEVGLSRLPDWLRTVVAVTQERNGLSADSPLNMRVIDQIVVACKESYSDAQMLDALNNIEVAEMHRDLFDWDEARIMMKSGLVRFGSHTRRHVRLLTSVGDEVMTDEVVGSKRIIQTHLDCEPKIFCYPNGDHSSLAVAKVKKEYLAAVTTARGWNATSADRYLLRRVGVHEDVASTPASFLSRIAGFG